MNVICTCVSWWYNQTSTVMCFVIFLSDLGDKGVIMERNHVLSMQILIIGRGWGTAMNRNVKSCYSQFEMSGENDLELLSTSCEEQSNEDL